MKVYADSNFLVRLAMRRPDSEEALELVEQHLPESAGRIPVTWLHRVETTNAFHLYVFQSSRDPAVSRVTPDHAAVAMANFEADLASGSLLASTILPAVEMERRFLDLSLRHTAKHGFRTYDLLHVASALLLGCDTFWSFDDKACRLAALEGLKLRPKRRSIDR